jgi:cobalt-zinc-cadmium efflux system protein
MHVHGPQRISAILIVSLAATLLYVIALLVAGVQAHSLALLSEAGHNASDLFALLLSFVAVYLQTRPPDQTKTYGYHRAGVLAAFLNALGLIVAAGFIFYEAAARLRHPVEVHTGIMIWVAAVGVVLNSAIGLALHRAGRDVNIRSAVLHQIGDTLSTAAVIVGGVAIAYTGQLWVDPALSVAIGVLILWSSFAILRETLNILLEGTPRGIRLEEIAAEIRGRAGVVDVHDLHVWSLGSEVHALSCHIAIADIPPSESEAILRDVTQRLEQRFHIHHTTIQFEHAACAVEHGCVMPVTAGHPH